MYFILDIHLFFHFKLIKNRESMCSTCYDRFRLRSYAYVTGIGRNRVVRFQIKTAFLYVAAGV